MPKDRRRIGKLFQPLYTDQPVEVTLQGGEMLIHSLEPQRAVTPGQSAVLYDGENCLGGGIVTEILDVGQGI